MAKNNYNNIDKAMKALGDDLKIEDVGQEIKLPSEEVSVEEQGYEIAEMADGGAEINFDPNAPVDKSQIPFDANLAEYIDEDENFCSHISNAACCFRNWSDNTPK